MKLSDYPLASSIIDEDIIPVGTSDGVRKARIKDLPFSSDVEMPVLIGQKSFYVGTKGWYPFLYEKTGFSGAMFETGGTYIVEISKSGLNQPPQSHILAICGGYVTDVSTNTESLNTNISLIASGNALLKPYVENDFIEAIGILVDKSNDEIFPSHALGFRYSGGGGEYVTVSVFGSAMGYKNLEFIGYDAPNENLEVLNSFALPLVDETSEPGEPKTKISIVCKEWSGTTNSSGNIMIDADPGRIYVASELNLSNRISNIFCRYMGSGESIVRNTFVKITDMSGVSVSSGEAVSGRAWYLEEVIDEESVSSGGSVNRESKIIPITVKKEFEDMLQPNAPYELTLNLDKDTTWENAENILYPIAIQGILIYDANGESYPTIDYRLLIEPNRTPKILLNLSAIADKVPDGIWMILVDLSAEILTKEEYIKRANESIEINL